MKYCNRCGNRVDKNFDFCERCGNRLSKSSKNVKNNLNNKWVIIAIFILLIPFTIGVIVGVFVPLINSFSEQKNDLEDKNYKEIKCDKYKHILSFRDTNNNLLMDDDVLMSGSARVSYDELGRPAISLSIADKEKFYEVTKKISQQDNNIIVIWLDYDNSTSYENERENCGNGTSKCLSAASVSQGFASDVIIQGDFTQKEVEEMVIKINCSLNKN